MTLQTSTSEACQIVAGGGSQPRNYAPGSPGPHLLDVWKFHIEAKEILDVISLTSIYSSQYQRRNENPFKLASLSTMTYPWLPVMPQSSHDCQQCIVTA